jgi:hypothetical protein
MGFEQPGGTPATPDAGRERGWGQQVAVALRVGPGQVAPAAQGVGVALHLEPPALQHGNAGLEPLQVVEG